MLVSRRTRQGFTLVEVLIVISIIGFLLMMAAPNISAAIANARARNVVSKFTGDFSWLRAQAATGKTAVTLTLSADCSWAASINTVADSAHSLAVADLNLQASGMTCVFVGAPVVFTFTPQGFVSPSVALSFSSAGGQSWPLQVLTSGSITSTKGAS